MSKEQTITKRNGFVMAKCQQSECSLPRTQHDASSRFEFSWDCKLCDEDCSVPVRAWREASDGICSTCGHYHSDHEGRAGVSTSWLRSDAEGFLRVCHVQWQRLNFDDCEVVGETDEQPDADEAL